MLGVGLDCFLAYNNVRGGCSGIEEVWTSRRRQSQSRSKGRQDSFELVVLEILVEQLGSGLIADAPHDWMGGRDRLRVYRFS